MLKMGSFCITRSLQVHLRSICRAASTAAPTAAAGATASPPAAAAPPTPAPVEDDTPRYIPRRACIYVPGDNEKMLRKIPGFGVDCAIMDCEDGVAAIKKDEARANIVRMLDELNFGRTDAAVRINSVDSGFAEDDLKTILKAKTLPKTIFLPKVELPDQIQWFEEKLGSTLKAAKKKMTSTINLIIYAESALGLLRLGDICQKAVELDELGSGVTLQGIVFGSDDFCASIGAERTEHSRELLYARQKVVLVAKAFQLQAIDLVNIDLQNLDGLRNESLEGAWMGFTGKQVIHPNQIDIVQTAFYPTPQRIKWATELIAAFEMHEKSGKGAFNFHGKMIDMPSVLQARNILQTLEQLKHVPPPSSNPPPPSTPTPPSTAPPQPLPVSF